MTRPAASGGATDGEREPCGCASAYIHDHGCTKFAAPPVLQADGDRERLAAALVEGVGELMPRGHVWNLDKALEPLLPVVRALVAEGAAKELRALAAKWDDESRDWYYDNRYTHDHGIGYVSGYEEGWDHAGQLACDRAAELDAK